MESPNSNYKNLASILLINAGNSSDATIVVDDADAAIMPSAPFYATIMPTTELANITNSEIVYVTASSSSGGETTYTVSRGQRGTTAQSWDAGKAVMTQAVYTQDVQAQKQGYYNAALSSGSAFTINNASAPTSPVVGSRISAIFDTDITTASTVTIAINGGTAYNVAVSGVTFDGVGTLTTSLTIASGKLYDMIFDGTEWVIANTFGKVATASIQDGAVTFAKTDPTSFYDVLYNGTAEGGNVTLSADPTTYARLRIYGVTTDNLTFFREVYAPKANGSFTIECTNMTASGAWEKIGAYTITSSGFTKNSSNSGEITILSSGSSTPSVTLGNGYIKINRVEGWKL